MHRVRGIDAAAATLQLEMQEYYKKNPSGVFEQCYMDPYSASLYPDGCLLASEGGAPRGVLTVPRAEIDAFNAAVWCPLKADAADDALMEGGGKFGPQCVLPPFLPSPLTPHPHLLSFMIRDNICAFLVMAGTPSRTTRRKRTSASSRTPSTSRWR